MRIDLNARVRTRDGENAGKIRYAIFNPDADDVSYFVVGTGGLFGQDVVVPANLIVPPEIAENTSYQEEVVILNLTKAELEGMPVFDHSRYSSPPAGWGSPSAHGYPLGNYLWSGLSKSYPVEPDPVIQSESRDPEELREAAIGKGAVVLDRNGNDIGVVEDLRFDTRGNDLVAVVVRIGGLIQTFFGAGETIEVPREMIASVTPEGVHLQASKEELKHLAKTD